MIKFFVPYAQLVHTEFEIPDAAPESRRCFFQYAGSPTLILALGAGKYVRKFYACISVLFNQAA